jgi:hypothetical protein
MVTATVGIGRKFAQLSTELIRDRPAAAAAIAAKLVVARGFYGIGAARFLMLGMYRQPMSLWPESMSYFKDVEPGLRTINWQSDGQRLSVDKLITIERFTNAGIPTAPLIAIIGRDSAEHPHDGLFANLSTVAEVAATLAAAPDRLFVKPATGWRGQGAMGPERRDGRWWVHGESLSERELAERLVATAPPTGLLVQERLRSHPALAPIGGELGLGCVRMNTALTIDGPEFLFAFAKIMGNHGLVDNFAGGKYGNLASGVDKASGALTRVFGRKAGRQYLIEAMNTHPITGETLIGFKLPLWPEVVDLAKRTASAFAETPLVGSDIAITDKGPRVIEIQSDWESNISQLTFGAGLRPLLREVVPRLAISDAIKHKAMRDMGLLGNTRRWRKPSRQERNSQSAALDQLVKTR